MIIENENMTDHDLAALIQETHLQLASSDRVNYYHDENYTTEVLVVFDNEKCTKKVYMKL